MSSDTSFYRSFHHTPPFIFTSVSFTINHFKGMNRGGAEVVVSLASSPCRRNEPGWAGFSQAACIVCVDAASCQKLDLVSRFSQFFETDGTKQPAFQTWPGWQAWSVQTGGFMDPPHKSLWNTPHLDQADHMASSSSLSLTHSPSSITPYVCSICSVSISCIQIRSLSCLMEITFNPVFLLPARLQTDVDGRRQASQIHALFNSIHSAPPFRPPGHPHSFRSIFLS